MNSKREFRIANEYTYNQSGPVRWVLSHLGRYKLFLISFVVTIAAANFLNASIRVQVGNAFNVVLAQGADVSALLRVVGTLLLIVVGRGLTDLAGSWSSEVLGNRLERDTRDELYLSLLGKSQTFHNRQRVGDVMARATDDVRQLNGMIAPGIYLILDSTMGLVMPLAFIASVRLALLLVPALYVVVFYAALKRYMNQLNPVAGQMRYRYGVMNAGLAEAIAGIEVVKSTAQEEQEMEKFTENAGTFRDYFIKEGQIQARYLPPLLLGFALSAALLHGLSLLSRGLINIGQLVTFIGLMFSLRFPTFISIFTFSLVQLGLAGADRILFLMKQETELDENEAGHSAPMRGELAFDNVTFGYGERPVLQNISFRAAPGQTIAIVGQTGAGKSTLTKLVNRTYDVTEGRITIDGVDVRDWRLDALRSQISAIEQDIFLFSRSIAENIGFGLGPKADPAHIETAAREAQAHDFITSFPDGYDTVIGERGVTLSGGQRQRLAIARALLTDPRILILDDATSAIDSATEDKIQTAINRVLQGRTTLLITHRLSQIRRADLVLVLEQGQVAAQGTHEELLRTSQLYRRIFLRHHWKQAAPHVPTPAANE
ncbi:MAG: ABC transporter ATP-binding protein [Anaerolineales bacterium]|nr:ABC transporter ATP-binding protein [Anaerolineales bacterium]MCB8950574.1 ABC transporter ATP-binding protein [Ardenticatenales bacterium]